VEDLGLRWNSIAHAAILLLLIAMVGCQGLSTKQGAAASPANPLQNTFSISGTISPAANGSGATLTLGGATNATTTADSSGNYSFASLANGSYTVTASQNGFSFSPSILQETVSGANVAGVNFAASPGSPTTYSISGTISPAADGDGVTVTLSGAISTITTANSSGNYAFTGLTPGSYTVTASQNGLTFSPPSSQVTVSGANVTGVNFTVSTGSTNTFSISGTISPAANGAGVTLTLSGATNTSTTANPSGNYSFAGLAGGSYTITPGKSGLTLDPPSSQVTVSGANVTGLNFTAFSGPVVSISPGTTIQTVVEANPAGTTFVLQPGLYRLQSSINPKNGDTFSGPACTPTVAPCTAIISGSILLCAGSNPCSGPDSNGNWSVTGMTQQGLVGDGSCDSGWSGCNYPEDLFVNGVPLQHINSPTLPSLTTNTWWFDYTNHIIHFHQNPVGNTVETSVLPTMLQSKAVNGVTVENLTVEEFAAPLDTGAVDPAYGLTPTPTANLDWTVQNSYFTLNHGVGVRIAFGTQVLNNVLTVNGNLGIGGGPPAGASITPSGVLVEGNTITYNNYAHFNPGFQGGGLKFGNTAYSVVRGNLVTRNIGQGIHFDDGSINPLIDGNTVTYNVDLVSNSGQGIIFEIGNVGATVRNNIAQYNGESATTGPNYQIGSADSAGETAYCNVMETDNSSTNMQSWSVFASDRGDNLQQPFLGQQIVSVGNYVHHNTVILDTGSTATAGYQQDDAANQPDFFANNTPPDYNTYHLPNTSAADFAYDNNNSGDNTPKTFTNYQAAGADVDGTIDANYTSGFPAVAVTSPADQSSVANPVTVVATASDASGIDKVEFYVDWQLQGTVIGSSPYNFSWTNGTSGAHTVAAMAYSSAGIRSCYAVTLNQQ
jgi:hypothetical protein